MTTETLPATAPAEPTTPIKPSEALRLGRLTRPRRTRGREFEGADGACARGAIVEGIGGTSASDMTVRWPRTVFEAWVCPDGRSRWMRRRCAFAGETAHIGYLVVHLNDYHRWSDERIVAWLESLDL